MSTYAVLKGTKIPFWSSQPKVERAGLSGKVVLIVGANVGLGFAAAKHFASMSPAKLILGCRSKERGVAALQRA